MVTKKPAASRSPKDAIAMLKADHKRVRRLIEQYDRLAGSDSADDERIGEHDLLD